MSIDSVSVSNRLNSTEAGRTQDAQPAEDRGRARLGGLFGLFDADRVQLSGLASRIQDGLGSETQSRAERVRHLARQVQSGRYQVDAAALSKTIVARSLDGTAQD